MNGRRLTVILPTFNERECLLAFASRFPPALAGYPHEILVVDDHSPDDTAGAVLEIAQHQPFRLLQRPRRLGLSSAVLDGLRAASGNIVAVMDADGSHPPEVLPNLIGPVWSGRAEFVLGSRYLPGGGEPGMRGSRRLMSRIAAGLVRPLTHVTDPMSGFFALDREILSRGLLNPTGFKIALEILVKCRPSPLIELPFQFQRRIAGESKLGSLEVGQYLRHVGRLYWAAASRRASTTR